MKTRIQNVLYIEKAHTSPLQKQKSINTQVTVKFTYIKKLFCWKSLRPAYYTANLPLPISTYSPSHKFSLLRLSLHSAENILLI